MGGGLNKYYSWCVGSWNTGSNQEACFYKFKYQALRNPPGTLPSLDPTFCLLGLGSYQGSLEEGLGAHS